MTAKVEGLDELTSTLRGLPNRVKNNVLRVAAAKAGSILREEARYQILANGLIDTGELFDSLRIAFRTNQDGVTARVHTGKAFYGLFHEFGTRKLSPRPFMRPALQKAAPQILRDVGEYIGKGIEVVAAKALKTRK